MGQHSKYKLRSKNDILQGIHIRGRVKRIKKYKNTNEREFNSLENTIESITIEWLIRIIVVIKYKFGSEGEIYIYIYIYKYM